MIRRETSFRTGFMALSVILSWLVMATATRAEVTWPDLLADPENAGLNRQFVSERLARGDLPAALSAVERLIVLRPTNIPARILRVELRSIWRMTRWRRAIWRRLPGSRFCRSRQSG